MANSERDHFILRYLDVVCRTKYQTTHHEFTPFYSFDKLIDPTPKVAPNPASESLSKESSLDLGIALVRIDSEEEVNRAASFPEDLPIHDILRLIQTHQMAETPEELKNAATFFEPLILHYPVLMTLMHELRRNLKIIPIKKDYDNNQKQLNKICDEIKRHSDRAATLELEKSNLTQKGSELQEQMSAEQTLLSSDKEYQDNIQAALVLVSLLNVIFREGMSAPWLADRFQLEFQQQEYCQLLAEHCDIKFSQKFDDIFTQHSSELNSEAVGWVRQIQGWFAYWNPRRLGIVRARRDIIFLGDYLNNAQYSSVIGTIDPFVRGTLLWVNMLSFIPRLSLNSSLMGYHLFDSTELTPLERALPKSIRFRAHWTRFWWEAVNDIYWLLMGIIFCFILTSGAVTLTTLCLSLTAQALDLVCAIARAYVDMQRICSLTYDLSVMDSDCPIKTSLEQKIHFERLACAYNIFHFLILMIGLCLTLPAMAAVSTMLPVIGATMSVLMSVITPYAQEYFQNVRQQIYEPRPVDQESLPRATSRIGML